MTLATVQIDGKPRRVILHAPKNGFFYVLDRDSGKPLRRPPEPLARALETLTRGC
jgi:quinohemoprotein ethanol dehydrogenase